MYSDVAYRADKRAPPWNSWLVHNYFVSRNMHSCDRGPRRHLEQVTVIEGGRHRSCLYSTSSTPCGLKEVTRFLITFLIIRWEATWRISRPRACFCSSNSWYSPNAKRDPWVFFTNVEAKDIWFQSLGTISKPSHADAKSSPTELETFNKNLYY